MKKFKLFEEYISEPLSPSTYKNKFRYLKINNIDDECCYLLDSDGNIQKPDIEEIVKTLLDRGLNIVINTTEYNDYKDCGKIEFSDIKNLIIDFNKINEYIKKGDYKNLDRQLSNGGITTGLYNISNYGYSERSYEILSISYDYGNTEPGCKLFRFIIKEKDVDHFINILEELIELNKQFKEIK